MPSFTLLSAVRAVFALEQAPFPQPKSLRMILPSSSSTNRILVLCQLSCWLSGVNLCSVLGVYGLHLLSIPDLSLAALLLLPSLNCFFFHTVNAPATPAHSARGLMSWPVQNFQRSPAPGGFHKPLLNQDAEPESQAAPAPPVASADAPPAAAKPEEKGKPLSEEELGKKLDNLLEEFLNGSCATRNPALPPLLLLMMTRPCAPSRKPQSVFVPTWLATGRGVREVKQAWRTTCEGRNNALTDFSVAYRDGCPTLEMWALPYLVSAVSRKETHLGQLMHLH